MATDKNKLQIYIDDDLLQQVMDFRFSDKSITSLSKAVQILLKRGLDKK